MEQQPEALIVPGAEEPGGQNVDAAAQADEEAGEHGHERGRGANGAQRLRTDELADYRQIRQIEQHLQEIGADEGQTKEKNLLSQRAAGHVLAGKGPHNSKPPNA